jgi:hypothetical protein
MEVLISLAYGKLHFPTCTSAEVDHISGSAKFKLLPIEDKKLLMQTTTRKCKIIDFHRPL